MPDRTGQDREVRSPMRRIIGLEELEAPLGPSVVTIGKFFAVHRGHQSLLRSTVKAARRRGVLSVALTFDRHPIEVLRPGTDLPILSSLEERLDLIEDEGIDITVVARVTGEFLAQEPEDFVRDVLARRLGAVEVLAGENFRFGKNARGDRDLLRALGREFGFEFTPMAPVMEGGERISSSRVAACVEAGRVRDAALLLGRPYSVTGTVERGEQVGRRLGFPTANIRTEPRRLLPIDGVYVAQVEHDGRLLAAAANLGVRPTVGGSRRLLEVHLPDWDGDLYDRRLRVGFIDRLRDERRFPDLNALRDQITRDVQAVRDYFTPGA